MSPERQGRNYELVREFFRVYPDFSLCRTLAENISENQTTHAEALRQLALKAQAARDNQREIEERLDRRSVQVEGETVRIKDLNLRAMTRLSNQNLRVVLEFYFKNPYAHGRCKKGRWIPGVLRSFPLRFLIGQARSRGMALDYPDLFELLRLL